MLCIDWKNAYSCDRVTMHERGMALTGRFTSSAQRVREAFADDPGEAG
jgi:hypothetical protein